MTAGREPAGRETAGATRWASGPAYEAYIGRWSSLVAEVFVPWLGVPARARWVDVGCGTGMLTRAILRLADPVAIHALDPSEAFLAHARASVEDPRVTWSVADAARTGHPDRSADAVVAGLVLNFVPDLEAALREAARIAAPGGVVAGYVWDYAKGMQLLRTFWDAVEGVMPGAVSSDEAQRYPVTVQGALAAAFASSGLADVAERPIEVPTVFRDFDDLWVPFLGGTGPGPAYVAGLDEAGRAAVRDELRRRLPVESDGSIHLTARAWAVRGRVGADRRAGQ